MNTASTLVVVVLLASGLVHASWNAMARSIDDGRASFFLMNVGVAVLCWVSVPLFGLPSAPSRLFLLASVVCHQAYELFLIGAYKKADFSKSYPIARGTAPALVTLGGLVFAHEHLAGWSLVGIFAIVVGISSLAWRSGEGFPDGTAFALATGAAIAVYTLIDGLGVRRSHDALRYAALLFALQSTLWLIGSCLRARRIWWPRTGRTVRGLVAGGLSMVAYSAVLWGQQHAALGLVSALRETGVLWAAVIGSLLFKEDRLRRVLVPAIVVVAGIALVSLG